MADDPKQVLRAAQIDAQRGEFSHPWNPLSQVRGATMARTSGLKRVSVNHVRIAPGKESYTPHAHQREEEWIYVLAGQGIVLIADEEWEVGPGDFIAFPAPQSVHHLRNPGPLELVCLMGGENAAYDAVDFPVQGKRLVRIGNDVRLYDAGADDPAGHPDAVFSAAVRGRDGR